MPRRVPTAPAVAGALTLAAGLVHVAAAQAHAAQETAVALFAVTAVVQVALGIGVLAGRSRAALGAAVVVDAVALVAWVASRTAGLPLFDGLGHPEAAGLQDLMAVLPEAAAVASAAVALRRGRPAPDALGMRRLSPVLVLALVPALVGITSPSEHDHGSEAGHSHEVAAGASHEHGVAPSGLAADPIFAGADTSHATTRQLEAAKSLIEATRGAVTARFPDRAALLAAGYRSIGDGLVTQYDHFVNPAYMNDGRELDPQHVESIVMERTPTGWRVASAMYILDAGKTMADVPDVAGPLTVWHDHQNLCWDASGLRLAGILLNGRCVPGGTFQATPPMLHVWLADHDCGPFAGIEGHGGDCTHTHS